MKILVVGGAGYIGSVCAELLLDEGHSVAVLDQPNSGQDGVDDMDIMINSNAGAEPAANEPPTIDSLTIDPNTGYPFTQRPRIEGSSSMNPIGLIGTLKFV